MYVYTWKTPEGVPFYVGMGTSPRRMKPHNKGHRNKACLELLSQIGPDNVVVEVRYVTDEAAAKALEIELIALYGRRSDNTGTLTNIAKGGEFHAASDKTRERLTKLWKDPEHRKKVVFSRKGKKRVLADSTKQVLRDRLASNPFMKSWSERNGKDPEFEAKRIAGLRASQPQRLAKMADPEALAQRKARLKATLNSPEYLEKRKLWDTPEYRAKIAAAKKAYWEKRKAGT